MFFWKLFGGFSFSCVVLLLAFCSDVFVDCYVDFCVDLLISVLVVVLIVVLIAVLMFVLLFAYRRQTPIKELQRLRPSYPALAPDAYQGRKLVGCSIYFFCYVLLFFLIFCYFLLLFAASLPLSLIGSRY